MTQRYSDTRFTDYIRPIYLARQVLADANITIFPVSLRIILRHYGIRVITYEDFCAANDTTMDECLKVFGRDGATISYGGRYVIVYNQLAAPKERIRFTLAHELGHIFHKHHDELGTKVLQRFWVEKSLYDVMEDEANCFARNLLSPPLATVELLRLHGFTATRFDDKQQRNVWLKVDSSPCISVASGLIRDDVLVRQAFRITDKGFAVGKRRDRRIEHTAGWRCTRCGAPRLEGSMYCYACGARNHFGFCCADQPPEPPVTVPYHGNHFRSCPFCGNPLMNEDALFCIMCGKPAANPCIPARYLSKPGTFSHLCPPGVRFCPTCGSRTLFSLKNIDHGYSPPAAPPEELPSDPFWTTKDLRLSRCLYCGQAKHDKDAVFCTMCGNPIVNACPDCSHRNIAIARYCEQCGQPTVFSVKGILPPYGEPIPVPAEYHAPPEPPEGVYTRSKRMEEERALERAEKKKQFEELVRKIREEAENGNDDVLWPL